MNFPELNRILRSEIFLRREVQLGVMHVILGFNPISKHFQSPKHVIRAKDPRLALIDIAVPGFLTITPPPAGTQDAQLLALLPTKLLYSQEPAILSNDEAKE